MTDAPTTAPPARRGPKTLEGKARSSGNALRHGLRARGFGVLPSEDPAAFARHAAAVAAVYAPRDEVELRLVESIAVAMWKELRADRIEADVLAGIERAAPAGARGLDLAGDGEGRTALAAAIRYQAAGQNAVRRGVDLLLKHRQARRAGLLDEAPSGAPASSAEPVPVAEDRTNEFLPPATTPPSARRRRRPAKAADAPPEGEPEAPPPPVEADPAREAKRLELLATLKPWAQAQLARTELALVEHFAAATHPDPTVYETWFAAQPKPAPEPLDLAPEDVAAIRAVTRHNPPWLRGAYLGYHRPPVPKAAFGLDPGGAPATRAEAPREPTPVAAAPPPPPEPPVPALRRRLARLLDRAAPRLPEELDLAEAVCALKWPKWPEYRGPIDPGDLHDALRGFAIDTDTLHWLGGRELAQACHAAAAAAGGA